MRRELAIKSDCPKCGATRGAPCIGRSRSRKSMHSERHGVTPISEYKPGKVDPRGYVYFIQCAETKFIKIGFSETFPTARLRQLQVGSGGKLHLVAFIQDRASRERELHRQFSEYHERGEWFRLEGCFADWLRELDV